MSKHMLRLAAPKTYPILRKESKYIVKIGAGPHPKEQSLPLLVVLRDMLKIAHTQNEIKRILNDKKVIVDGKVRKNPKIPIGFMDIISLPILKHNYRVLFDRKGVLQLIKISDHEAKSKLCKIMDKTIIRDGKIQLNLHDGRNIIVNDQKFKSGDSILITLPDQKITKHLQLEREVMVYITDGKHVGETATIINFHPIPGSTEDTVLLKNETGGEFETLKKYVFVLGKEKSEIHITGEHK